MPALGLNDPTLLDIAKTLDPSGRGLARIVNLMKQRSSIVEDAVWMEGNLATGTRVTSTVGLPTPSWNTLNRGVATSKHKDDSYDEACGLLESASEVDARFKKIYGAAFAEYRRKQDLMHQLAMLQELETGMFYHSTGTDPRRINGLAARYDSTTRAMGGSQVIRADAAPSGADQTSVWLVKWAEDAVHCIYPKDSQAGIESKDMGELELEDATGAKYPGFKTYHSWMPGLVVADYRQVVRVCNIDTSALAANGTNLVEAMIRGYYQLQNPNGGRLRWYCNRTVATFLHLQARNDHKQNPVVVQAHEGKEITTFLGIPVRISDSILNTEAIIS